MQKFRSIILYIGFICLSFCAQARWATEDDMNYITNYFNENIIVDENGLSETVTEEEYIITKDSAREEFSNFSFLYNENAGKIEILEAKTILNGVDYPVAAEMIEDKHITSGYNGFDQKRKITISFPNLEIGSKIYLKTRSKILKQPYDKFFSVVFHLGQQYTKKIDIKIESVLPLYLEVNDPDKLLNIKRSKHKIHITNKKSILYRTIDEPQNSFLNYKKTLWLAISSSNKWQDILSQKEIRYNSVINQPLPEMFESIRQIASKEQTEVDQINTVTSLLNDKVSYMGDWRTIEGGFFPRSLIEIARTQYGDCKDFSSVTAAILRKMGYKAQPIFVIRGEYISAPYTLPTGFSSNHAMTKVTSQTGKTYWIDPTNLVSISDGIFADIAGKDVLVLNNESYSLEKTPNADPKHNQIISEKVVTFLDNNYVQITGKTNLKGEAAIGWTAAELSSSKLAIKDQMYNLASNANLDEEDKIYMNIPDLKSRDVHDINISYSFKQKDKIFKTNLGTAFPIDANWIYKSIDVTSNRVSDLYLSEPNTFTKRYIFKNVVAENIESLNCNIDNKWFTINRKCKIIGNDTQITDTVIQKVNIIENHELKTQKFIKLRNDIQDIFHNTSITFTKHIDLK